MVQQTPLNVVERLQEETSRESKGVIDVVLMPHAILLQTPLQMIRVIL